MNLSGLHMVFGVYGKDISFGKYANHQTLFFAPTSSEGKNGNNNKSYALDQNEIIFLDFNQKTLSNKNNNAKSGYNSFSLIANELGATPPDY